MRKVCMAIIDRANWGRCQTVAEAIHAHSDFELSIVCGGSTPLDRFKNPAEQIREHGFNVAETHYHEVEGSVPVSMARSGGLAQMDFAAAFSRIKPDLIYLVGDRYQAVAVAMAAVTLGIPLVHQQGGEVSGALDERYRHAITKLADWHVPATEQAKENVIRMGERPESVMAVGCPSADIAARIRIHRGEYLLVAFHPDTNCSDRAGSQITEVLDAVYQSEKPTRVMWPNVDAGSCAVSKAIRCFRDTNPRAAEWDYLTNVEPEAYLQLLANAACCVGNSSSFVRDAGYFGTPVVLVGERQSGRECGANVVRVPCDLSPIRRAILSQIEHGQYPPSDLYGSHGISENIAARLATIPLYVQKQLTFSEVEAIA